MFNAIKEFKARSIVDNQNNRIKNIALNMFRSGNFRSYDEALRTAIQKYGPTIANEIQNKLRSMGARDVVVTCP